MKISVTDFLAPIGVRAFKFCVHLQILNVYFVNENENARPHFAFFFKMFNVFFCHIYIIHMDILLSKISQQLLHLGL